MDYHSGIARAVQVARAASAAQGESRMRDIRIAAAQFEARDADKEYNLGRIEALASQAAGQGA